MEVAIYLLSTSNRNPYLLIKLQQLLLYIFFLHQTATVTRSMYGVASLLYIFFLHQTATTIYRQLQMPMLLYIFFLHQTATYNKVLIANTGCYISSFYIKPQPDNGFNGLGCVAIYLLSTSNRNSIIEPFQFSSVAIYLLSTSNRNQCRCQMSVTKLLYIFFLHQTATWSSSFWCRS